MWGGCICPSCLEVLCSLLAPLLSRNRWEPPKKKKNHPVFPYPGRAGCSADGDWRVPCRAVTPAVRGLSHQARLSR